MDGDFKEGTGRESHLSLVISPSRAERAKWWIVTLLPVVPVAVLTTVAIATALLWYHPTKQQSGLFGNLGQAFEAMQSGGTAASAAATTMGPQPAGTLNMSILNAALPHYEWVDGAMSVPHSSKRPVVGVAATGTHIVTAIQVLRGWCSYGLTITSDTDPLIAEDQLLGPGTYYKYVDLTSYQYVYHVTQCVADQAPGSGWASWSYGLP